MTNIVMLARDRPRLTEQALRTLYMNTHESMFSLAIVDDGSQIETQRIIQQYGRKDNCEVVSFLKPIGIVGFLRNVGIAASERFFGREECLYLSDNDVAYLPGWLDSLRACLADCNFPTLKVIGGYHHPFHGVKETFGRIGITDAVAGYSQLMTWYTWDDFGPFDQHCKGVCQSEDFAFCQKIVNTPLLGYKVGYIDPPVIVNCGITNSEGKPAIGAEHFPRIKGLIYE